MSELDPVQRLRLTFSEGETVKYIAHLALMRTWERIFRRADLPIAYSQGFNPRPRLTFASALSVGVIGRAEVMDIELRQPIAPEELLRRLKPQLSPDFVVRSVQEVPLRGPALQAQVRYAVYVVRLRTERTMSAIQERLEGLLAAGQLLREREVKGRQRRYDLRPLVHDLWYAGYADGCHLIGMILVNNNTAAGRPDEVLNQLGLADERHGTERVRLLFADDPVERGVVT